ncbi:MAG: DUF5916 domain-containing protein [Ginsengibacter sp.]
MKKLILLIINFLLITSISNAQSKKPEIKAVKTASSFTIDGKLSEAAWKEASLITGLIETSPNFGINEDKRNRTEVYILYDNNNIYIGGYCHENSRDSISKELVGRDQMGSNDFIGVIFDTYYDKINGTGFFVTPYGEQFDAKYSNSGEDASWNSVWESASEIQSDGWTFEMRIPYSAIRFSNKDNQSWGLNIIRQRNKSHEKYTWSPVDPTVNGLLSQEGLLTSIEKINPPLRLSLSPYFSTYLNHYPYKTSGVNDYTTSINGGMDIKYGINESFTLDMTLIPDFGQVQSDNKVLNLSPFEVKYNENRSFFTEGTELFSIGNLFYSRRIGSMPVHFYDVYQNTQDSEQVVSNPTESKLINATKISGRTSKGLGIGFLNAITKPMYATLENNKGERRQVQTGPLTNYNIIVLDQTLKNNSSVSFINTSVIRKGKDYDANVSALAFNLNNKANTYNWSGKFALSNIYDPLHSTVSGYAHYLQFSKSSGRFVYEITQVLEDENYNPNDLGILFNNNDFIHHVWMQYNWLKPTTWYKNLRINYNIDYSRQFHPSAYQSFSTDVNANSLLKNFMSVGAQISYDAVGKDFYEPRVKGKVFTTPSKFDFEMWLKSNQAKKYSFYVGLEYNLRNLFQSKSYSIELQNTYRFSDKFSLQHSINWNPSYNRAGFEDVMGTDIIFSRRNVKTIENSLSSKFNFNKKSGITLDIRHYWSEVQVKDFYTLQTDGSLSPNNTYQINQNQNFNAFNINMVYTWEFAPGSFINIVWKNSIYDQNQIVKDSYFKNLKNTLGYYQNNNISLKVIYYLDALVFRKKKS